MKKIKNIYFFAGMFCIFVCAAVLLIPVIEASRKQKIMNGVYAWSGNSCLSGTKSFFPL